MCLTLWAEAEPVFIYLLRASLVRILNGAAFLMPPDRARAAGTSAAFFSLRLGDVQGHWLGVKSQSALNGVLSALGIATPRGEGQGCGDALECSSPLHEIKLMIHCP